MYEASKDISNTGPYIEGDNSVEDVGGNKNTNPTSNVTTENITGKGIIIGNDIKTGDITIVDTQVFINEISNECGLTLIHPDHFEDNSDTSNNFENWKKGFSLSLESIYQKKEFVREKVLDELREKLEERKRLLILGESGSSKTTLLMEIICRYFDHGYKILYNFGDDELKNTNTITEKIKGLAYGDNQILIVIDNVHSPKMSLIFNVINNIQPLNLDKKDRIRFLLAARQPEFDWVLERNLFDDSLVSQRIEELFDDNYKYTIPYFTKDETKEFISKYSNFLEKKRQHQSLDENTTEIFNDTKGYPILVRFSVLNQGLRNHVKQMFEEYLLEKTKINLGRMKITILNSLFDMSTLALKDEILNELEISDIASSSDIAYDMNNTLIKKSEDDDVWKTINPKWDLELFRYLFSLKLDLRHHVIRSFCDVIGMVFKSQKISVMDKLFVLNTIFYTLIKEKVVTFETIEKIIKIPSVEEVLDNKSKLLFYATIVGFSYYDSGRNEDSLNFYDKALELDPKNLYAYNNKGLSLSRLERDQEAISCYEEALRIDPNAIKVLFNKGVSLSRLGKDEEAILSYERALELDPNYKDALNGKGDALFNQGNYTQAIEYYDKALELDPNNFYAYYNKGLSLSRLERDQEALSSYDKALEFNPNNFYAYYNKGLSLSRLERDQEALSSYDKALELNQSLSQAIIGKASSLFRLKKNDQAKNLLEKLLQIEPKNSIALQLRAILEEDDIKG